MDEEDVGVSSLVRDFGKLIGDNDTSDVVFFVGHNEELIRAHKLILWARLVAAKLLNQVVYIRDGLVGLVSRYREHFTAFNEILKLPFCLPSHFMEG